MKRWIVLTTAFALLGGGIMASGCQPSNTATTTGGGGQADDCTQACISACMDDCSLTCQEACSHCEIMGNTYDCTTPDGLFACICDFNFLLCQNICESICENGCTFTPSYDTPDTSDTSDTNRPAPVVDLVEGIDYEVRILKATYGFTLTLEIELVFLKNLSDISLNFTTYAQPSGLTYNEFNLYYSSQSANSVIYEKVYPTPTYPENTGDSYTISITSAKGIRA